MGTAVFGAPEFKARSGRTIKVLDDSTMHFHLGNGYLAPNQVMDAEEFFQAKHDAELGRWRWPENPHYVVYPLAGQARVIDERTGREHVFGRVDNSREWAMADAAEAYFEAHPERKPWQDAQPGHMWVLVLDGSASECGAIVTSDRRYQVGDSSCLAPSDPLITDGRRIWPEDAS